MSDFDEMLLNRTRIVIMIKTAHRHMRRKYLKIPLWSFISDLTGYGATNSEIICREMGLNPHQDGSKPI